VPRIWRLLVLAIIVLAIPGVAGAHTYHECCWGRWIGRTDADGYGRFTSTTTTYNRGCIWYGSGEWCNGWNYWDLNEVYRGAQFADVLHGFENYERIRGCVAPSPHHQWFYCYRWDVGMGGYMRGQLLWWGSSGDSFVYIVDAHTWSGLV
jgi:hypothetical protein